jgi:hypothetical protein
VTPTQAQLTGQAGPEYLVEPHRGVSVCVPTGWGRGQAAQDLGDGAGELGLARGQVRHLCVEAADGPGEGLQGAALLDLGVPKGLQDTGVGAAGSAGLGGVAVGQGRHHAGRHAVLPQPGDIGLQGLYAGLQVAHALQRGTAPRPVQVCPGMNGCATNL